MGNSLFFCALLTPSIWEKHLDHRAGGLREIMDNYSLIPVCQHWLCCSMLLQVLQWQRREPPAPLA